MWREIAEKSGKQKSQKCSALMAVRSIWNRRIPSREWRGFKLAPVGIGRMWIRATIPTTS